MGMGGKLMREQEPSPPPFSRHSHHGGGERLRHPFSHWGQTWGENRSRKYYITQQRK